MAAYHELDQTGDRLANSVPTAGTLLSGTSTSINEVVVNERIHKSLQLQKTQYWFRGVCLYWPDLKIGTFQLAIVPMQRFDFSIHVTNGRLSSQIDLGCHVTHTSMSCKVTCSDFFVSVKSIYISHLWCQDDVTCSVHSDRSDLFTISL